MTLYELTQEMQELLNMLEQLPAEIPAMMEDGSNEEEVAAAKARQLQEEQAITDTLEMVAMDFTDKADGYGKVLRQMQAEISAVKAEKMRLARRQSLLEAREEKLSDALRDALLQTGKKNLKTDLFTFGTRKSEQVIPAEDWRRVPDDFLKYLDPVPDKVAMKKYLKSHPDEEFEWGHMQENIILTIR